MIDNIRLELASKVCEHEDGGAWCGKSAEVIVSFEDAICGRRRLYYCAKHGEPEAE